MPDLTYPADAMRAVTASGKRGEAMSDGASKSVGDQLRELAEDERMLGRGGVAYEKTAGYVDGLETQLATAQAELDAIEARFQEHSAASADAIGVLVRERDAAQVSEAATLERAAAHLDEQYAEGCIAYADVSAEAIRALASAQPEVEMADLDLSDAIAPQPKGPEQTEREEPLITTDPGVCGGAPCFAGHRLQMAMLAEEVRCSDGNVETVADYFDLDVTRLIAALAEWQAREQEGTSDDE